MRPTDLHGSHGLDQIDLRCVDFHLQLIPFWMICLVFILDRRTLFDKWLTCYFLLRWLEVVQRYGELEVSVSNIQYVS